MTFRFDDVLRATRLDAWWTAAPWLNYRPSWRALALLGGSLAVLGSVVTGAWLWFAAEQRRGLEAFADAMVTLQTSQFAGAKPEERTQAISGFEGALGEKPSGAIASQVTYELGNLKYGIPQYPESRVAYELAARGTSPTLRRLAQMSLGYTWEAQKDYLKAIEAFQSAQASLKPGDFLYEDLAMDLGRVQELAGRKDDAIATYRRVASSPKGLRSDEARTRLANFGVQP